MTLAIYKPEYKDLWFKQMMLSDEATMSYNHAWGGTVPFPEEKWKSWYEHWIINTEGIRYYRYLKNEDDQFIGEIAYHFDDDIDGYVADVIIFAKYRGQGYGAQALSMLCAAAKKNGIFALYDDIAIDNPAVSLFLKQGFSEENRTDEIIIMKKEL